MERTRGSGFPFRSMVLRVKLQGVRDDAERGLLVQQPAPVQESVCDPSIRIAGSEGSEQESKVRVSEFPIQPELLLDQLQEGTAQLDRMGLISRLRVAQ